MSKAVGMRDVLHVLAHYPVEGVNVKNEIELLDKDVIEKIKPVLFSLGIDVRFPIDIDAAKYRDLNNKVGIGYRFVGNIRQDREYANSPLCDIIERISIARERDAGLAKDMASMVGTKADITMLASYNSPDDSESLDELSPTWKEDAESISKLYDVLSVAQEKGLV